MKPLASFSEAALDSHQYTHTHRCLKMQILTPTQTPFTREYNQHTSHNTHTTIFEVYVHASGVKSTKQTHAPLSLLQIALAWKGSYRHSHASYVCIHIALQPTQKPESAPYKRKATSTVAQNLPTKGHAKISHNS